MEVASFGVRAAAVWLIVALAMTGCSKSKSTNDLIQEMNSKSEFNRVKAVRMLQNRQGDPTKVIPALIKSLKDRASDVRLSAAIGLGYFGAKAESALSGLQESLQDPDARVREAVRVAISRIQPADRSSKRPAD